MPNPDPTGLTVTPTDARSAGGSQACPIDPTGLVPVVNEVECTLRWICKYSRRYEPAVVAIIRIADMRIAVLDSCLDMPLRFSPATKWFGRDGKGNTDDRGNTDSVQPGSIWEAADRVDLSTIVNKKSLH
jgi:hypothetical protein